MNAGLSADHASIHYYDSDYPSHEHSLFPENFDRTTVLQGISDDVTRYKEIASGVAGPILELCCGTGRVAIPLAKQGHHVTGVDVSASMLACFGANLQRVDAALGEKITRVEQDMTQLSLPERRFALAIIAFNSLLLVATVEGQMQALERVADHLADDGLFVLDIVNPLRLKIDGDPIPRPFFTRKNPNTGNWYTRFAMFDAFDEHHCQRLHGWYDEVDADGRLHRRHYSMHWRPIFRTEIELMLHNAGFRVEQLEGGHRKEPYTAQSPRMFIQARKRA